MSSHPEEKSISGRLRTVRLCVAFVLVLFPLSFIFDIGRITTSENAWPIAFVYFVFLVVCGGLLALIAGQLFKQHEVREMKLDIGTMLLVTTLIALPFGTANLIVGLADQRVDDSSFVAPGGTGAVDRPLGAIDSNDGSNGEKVVTIAIVLFFLVAPVLLITEHLVTWRSRRTERLKRAKIRESRE